LQQKKCGFRSQLLLLGSNFTSFILPPPVAMSPIANRNFTLGLLLLAVLAKFAVNPVRAEPAEPGPPTANITAEPIELWAIQLDDNRFDIRQRAQQQLEQLGKPALARVAAVAKRGTLESSTRAINILLHWSEVREQDLRLAALEELASMTNRPRESAMAMRLLAEVREQAALEAITHLGGKVTNLGGYGNLQIEIDKNWKGGNEGLKHLADVRHAKKIIFRVAPITDSGFEHLAKLAQVKVLEIYGTQISSGVLKKIKQQLPNTVINFRDGAMLGILGNPNDTIQGSVAVTNVVKNGAADKAGIVPGDRIAELNGEKLEDFTALTERIATYEAGDTVTLTILRKGKPQTVQVTFDLWGSTDNNKLVHPKVPSIHRLPMPGLPRKIQVPRR